MNPTFKTIPDSTEISTINRDLRFHPCSTEHPQVLTSQEIQHFNERGYIRRIRFFDEQQIASIRAYFDQLLERVVAQGGNSYSISTAHLKYGRVWDLLTDPKIVAVVRDLLGPNVIGWGSHFFCKMPGDGKTVSWHQDSSYWPLTPSKAITVWLAIDDADEENACMRYIPGSHLYGHLTYEMSEDSESNVLNQSVRDAEGIGDPIDVELKAGEAAIHSDLLLHGSEMNRSNRRRCGLTLRYCPADVTAHLEWNQKGVMVSGNDDRGHWSNQPRPATD